MYKAYQSVKMLIDELYAPQAVQEIRKWISKYEILSFDCATRNLGFCHITMDPLAAIVPVATRRILNRSSDLEQELSRCERQLELLKHSIDNLFRVNTVSKWDLGKYVDPWTTASELRQQLSALQCAKPDAVIYEFQMNANDKSRMVSNFIAYAFCDCPRVVRIGPSIKNTISFTPDLSYQTFLARSSVSYAANKKHTAENLRYYCRVFGISLSHLKKIDDAADAFMQAVGAIKHGKLLL